MTDIKDVQITTTEDKIEHDAPNWYKTWRGRIHTWIKNNSDDLIADIVLFVPDMFMLTVGLIKDKRVPFLLKAQLMLSAAYVLTPIDLIPEGLSGVIGLVDDASVLALTLYWIRNIIGIDPQILKDNWIGENDLNQVIQDVHQRVNDNANQLFSGDIWTAIRKRFDKSDTQSDLDASESNPDAEVSQMGKTKVSIEIDFE